MILTRDDTGQLTHTFKTISPSLSSQLARWQRPSAWRDLGSRVPWGSMLHRARARAGAGEKKSLRRLCLEDCYGSLGRRVRGCVSGVYLLASRKYCVSQCICSQFLCISHLFSPKRKGLGVKCGAVRVQCTVGRSSVVVEFNHALAVKSMQSAWIGRLSIRKIP